MKSKSITCSTVLRVADRWGSSLTVSGSGGFTRGAVVYVLAIYQYIDANVVRIEAHRSTKDKLQEYKGLRDLDSVKAYPELI